MILLIDTAQDTATTALASGGRVLFAEENIIAKDAARWLHPAIGRLLEQAKISACELDAVAVVAGPGSYTGLRVGMAAAKGFCYALKIPLIIQNTLRVMAEAMKSVAYEKDALICPMIDARRDEVFTALYRLEPVNGQPPTDNRQRSATHGQPPIANRQPSTVNRQPPTINDQRPTASDLHEILPPQALILDKNVFEKELSGNSIVFFGSGAEKWKKIPISPAAIFYPQQNTIQAFAKLAQEDFLSENWADPVYTEPVYLKEFFSY